VELVEGAEVSVPPKEAMAEATRVGQRGQAMAAAIQIARGIKGRERRASGAGLGRLTDPDPSRVSLAVPEWAGWASWPVGPNRLWPIVLNQNFKFKFKCYSFWNSKQIQKFK
jgi:hypothetical protein